MGPRSAKWLFLLLGWDPRPPSKARTRLVPSVLSAPVWWRQCRRALISLQGSPAPPSLPLPQHPKRWQLVFTRASCPAPAPNLHSSLNNENACCPFYFTVGGGWGGGNGGSERTRNSSQLKWASVRIRTHAIAPPSQTSVRPSVFQKPSDSTSGRCLGVFLIDLCGSQNTAGSPERNLREILCSVPGGSCVLAAGVCLASPPPGVIQPPPLGIQPCLVSRPWRKRSGRLVPGPSFRGRPGEVESPHPPSIQHAVLEMPGRMRGCPPPHLRMVFSGSAPSS